MNIFTFSGRLARDAEQRYTTSGTALLSFTVANDVGYGDKKQTNWVDCVLFGKRAEGALAQHLTKGAQVVCSGEVTLNEYDKRDGTKGASLRVNVRELDLVGGKQQDAPQSKPQQPAEDFDAGQDVPF